MEKWKPQNANQTRQKQTTNSKINAGMNQKLSGEDRSELNIFMQHGLLRLGYLSEDVKTVLREFDLLE